MKRVSPLTTGVDLSSKDRPRTHHALAPVFASYAVSRNDPGTTICGAAALRLVEDWRRVTAVRFRPRRLPAHGAVALVERDDEGTGALVADEDDRSSTRTGDAPMP